MKNRSSAFAPAVAIILVLSFLVPVCAVGQHGEAMPVSVPVSISEVAGDSDGDEEVTTQDVLLIRKALAGIVSDEDLIMNNSDVDRSGETDVRDVLKIRKYLAGIEKSLSRPYTIMSYNVGLWYDGSGLLVPENEYEKYLGLHENIIDTYSPDILCIQEYCDELSFGNDVLDDLLGERFGYIETAKGTAANYNYIGKAVCSKLFMENPENSALEPDGVFDSPNYEKVYIKLNGRRVCVISAHMAAHPYLALLEMYVIAREVEDEEYFIICADTNIDASISQNIEDIKSVFDLYGVSCNFANGGEFGSFATCPSNGKAIDNIITSKNIVIDSVTVDKQKDTLLTENGADVRDHYPVIATVYVD